MDAGLGDLVDDGQWLVERRIGLERAEAEWLERLARFDRDGLWALDGHFCCATWLVWRLNMKRSTAFEKLRVAHELARRPIVAAAFRRGDISYSAVRAITRMPRPDPEVDEAMVTLAAKGDAAIVDVEQAVRAYMLYHDQDRPLPDDRQPVRDVKITRREDGTGRLVVDLSDVEVEEVAAALQAFIDMRYRPKPGEESSREEDTGAERTTRLVDESSRGDLHSYPQPQPGGEAPLEQASRPAQKADAFMDMVTCALAGADGGHAAGDDRYMVHVVTRDQGGSFTFLDGAPIHPDDAAVLTCGCSTVTHTVAGEGEPLHLGRKTREWSTAQRRAISVRDGGHCRFPGCAFTHYDIHHMRPWEADGRTDVDNGFCQCRRHHRMVHSGYRVEGDPNGELYFYRPDGSYLDTTRPAAATVLVGV